MAAGEAIIKGELMATGEAELHSVQTTRDSRIFASWDCRFACLPINQLEFRFVLIFVTSKFDREQDKADNTLRPRVTSAYVQQAESIVGHYTTFASS